METVTAATTATVKLLVVASSSSPAALSISGTERKRLQKDKNDNTVRNKQQCSDIIELRNAPVAHDSLGFERLKQEAILEKIRMDKTVELEKLKLEQTQLLRYADSEKAKRHADSEDAQLARQHELRVIKLQQDADILKRENDRQIKLNMLYT